MLDDIPMPAVVAQRPRDLRGFPVPATTPWVDGQPRFGMTGVQRTFLCAVDRRCSICGTTMAPGAVWRVVGAEEAEAIAEANRQRRAFRDAASTTEAPGHRTCMLYAAMTCPWLSRPTARRSSDATVPGVEIVRGVRRGHRGAVVGYETYDFTFSQSGGVQFRFGSVMQFLPHDVGTEHLPLLRAAVRDESIVDQAPDYLGADERLADRAFSAYLDRLLG